MRLTSDRMAWPTVGCYRRSPRACSGICWQPHVAACRAWMVFHQTLLCQAMTDQYGSHTRPRADPVEATHCQSLLPDAIVLHGPAVGTHDISRHQVALHRVHWPLPASKQRCSERTVLLSDPRMNLGPRVAAVALLSFPLAVPSRHTNALAGARPLRKESESLHPVHGMYQCSQSCRGLQILQLPARRRQGSEYWCTAEARHCCPGSTRQPSITGTMSLADSRPGFSSWR